MGTGEDTIGTTTKVPHHSRIVLYGPPGCGKGTLAQHLVTSYGLVHVSSGVMIRKAIEAETEVGTKARGFVEEGKLVPDEIVVQLVREALQEDACRTHGWVLDGFPRDMGQMEALDEMGNTPDIFLILEVSDEVGLKRISGRRVDPVTKTVYHLTTNPPPDNPAIQARLVQRSEDTEEQLTIRLANYYENLNEIALKDTYRAMTRRVNANLCINEVWEHVKRIVEEPSSISQFNATEESLVCDDGAVEVQAFCMRETEQEMEEIQDRGVSIPKKEDEDEDKDDGTPVKIGVPRIIVFGARASGKRTLCTMLAKKYGVVHISSGQLCEETAQHDTEEGRQCRSAMEQGKLVVEDVVSALVIHRLQEEDCRQNGWVLEGFPLTGEQAETLQGAGFLPHAFLVLEVREELIVERITNLRTDPMTGKEYNINREDPSMEEDVRKRLIQKSENTEEAVFTLLANHAMNLNEIRLMADSYRKAMKKIDGNRDIARVFRDTCRVIGKWQKEEKAPIPPPISSKADNTKTKPSAKPKPKPKPRPKYSARQPTKRGGPTPQTTPNPPALQRPVSSKKPVKRIESKPMAPKPRAKGSVNSVTRV